MGKTGWCSDDVKKMSSLIISGRRFSDPTHGNCGITIPLFRIACSSAGIAIIPIASRLVQSPGVPFREITFSMWRSTKRSRGEESIMQEAQQQDNTTVRVIKTSRIDVSATHVRVVPLPCVAFRTHRPYASRSGRFVRSML